ncbi:MAG TPA: hypothetical protein VFR75_04330 [Solirubrobacterales bacterium]|nr:hypothetical protein [Solirubrobacterales bacterium]
MSAATSSARAAGTSGDLPTVTFRSSFTADAIDKALITGGWESLPNEMLFDLGEVQFADPSGLLYLAAVVTSLTERGVTIKLDLPRSKKVRDLMRRYRFGSTLNKLIEPHATELLTDGSLAYTEEAPLYYLASRRGVRPTTSQKRALTRLSSFLVSQEPSQEAAIEGMNWWMDQDLKTLLERVLGSKAALIAPGIVYEALSNAASHPDASRLISTGFLDERARGGKGMLTIAIWDNGKSIVSTLKAALGAGSSLRMNEAGNRRAGSSELNLYFDWYGLFEGDSPGARKQLTKLLYSGDSPDHEASDAELLVSSAFPGITSNPWRQPDESSIHGPHHNQPGMGLYILTSLAIDSFGGEVLLRTDSLYANFKRAPRELQEQHRCRYRVGVVQNPAMGSYLRGNHLVVRLPLISG